MINSKPQTKSEKSKYLEIKTLDYNLYDYYKTKIKVMPSLNRQLVSFQANKSRPIYRWYKYKEAFSATLVEYFIDKYNITNGTLLDPFAGIGTSLFAASSSGLDSVGIELLPIGQQIISIRNLIQNDVTKKDVERLIKWINPEIWEAHKKEVNLHFLRITDGAYPEATKSDIERFLSAIENEEGVIKEILKFALFCVLEDVSYTRKDGQYLRWDSRANRSNGNSQFNKGKIAEFKDAIAEKIHDIVVDLSPNLQPTLLEEKRSKGEIYLYNGSSLKILPRMPENSFSSIITSPPYCNRYDYTRTYALELALLNTSEDQLSNLRQEMLSCTVENREKDLIGLNPLWIEAIEIADKNQLLQTILGFLNQLKDDHTINNSGIPRMVKGYFYEMACVISECLRVLKPGSRLIMVNDNVRYAGISISVDLILSNIAEELGFTVENILVLPNGKGNSSQQMGEHGQEVLRKCVYVWRKP